MIQLKSFQKRRKQENKKLDCPSLTTRAMEVLAEGGKKYYLQDPDLLSLVWLSPSSNSSQPH